VLKTTAETSTTSAP